jgi:hypothetical protein
MTEKLQGLALSFTQPISEYAFLERGHLVLNDVEVEHAILGDVDYASPIFDLFFGIKYHDWIFVIECNKVTKTCAIGGFYHNAHYFFQQLDSFKTSCDKLLNFFVQIVLPLYDQNTVDRVKGQKIQWNIKEVTARLYTPEELQCKLQRR